MTGAARPAGTEVRWMWLFLDSARPTAQESWAFWAAATRMDIADQRAQGSELATRGSPGSGVGVLGPPMPVPVPAVACGYGVVRVNCHCRWLALPVVAMTGVSGVTALVAMVAPPAAETNR